jgi:hypothetical protein
MDKALPRRVFADYFANLEWFDTHSEAVRAFTGIDDRAFERTLKKRRLYEAFKTMVCCQSR